MDVVKPKITKERSNFSTKINNLECCCQRYNLAPISGTLIGYALPNNRLVSKPHPL